MKVREAVIDDSRMIAQINVSTWKSAYQGLIPQTVLDELSVEDREGLTRQFFQSDKNQIFVLVAEDTPGKIIGYAIGGPERSCYPSCRGEIYAIYIAEPYQRQGVGHLLVQRSAEKLLSLNISSMLVWVLKNSPYRKFYESIGGRQSETQEEEILGFKAKLTAYVWNDITELF